MMWDFFHNFTLLERLEIENWRSSFRMKICMKNDLLTCLEEFCLAQTEASMASSVTVEKTARVQMLHPKDARIISEHTSNILILYIMLKLHSLTNLDIEWNRYMYIEDSLEGMAMKNFGKRVSNEWWQRGSF